MAQKLNVKEFVNETRELWQEYASGNRSVWAEDVRENELFRYGNQWTEEQKKLLEARGQVPVVINRIDPAVELAKSILTANTPSFRFISVEDSDNQVAQALNGLVEYIWRMSEGKSQLQTAVDDFLVKAMGAWQVYIDKYADGGKGEVKFRAINPLDIYIDPNSRSRFCDDAAHIIVSREYTKKHLEHILPEYKKKIKEAASSFGEDRLAVDSEGSTNLVFEGEYFGQYDDYVRGYERYDKIWINRYRVFEKWSGRELVFDEEKLEDYFQKPCWIINDRLVVEENEAKERIVAAQMEYQREQEEYEQLLQAAEQNPDLKEQMIAQDIQPPVEPEIVKTTLHEIHNNTEQIEIVTVPVERIQKAVIIGEELLERTVLPCSRYPIIIFMNKHTGSPYPQSDVSLVKDQQRFINKMKSLIIAHASAATNVKVMVPMGSDVAKIQEQWSQPNAVIEVDFDAGNPPIPVQPLPLPNELYANVSHAKEDIDYQFGLFESMHGNAQQAPDTARGIIMMDEFGYRRIKTKQDILENALERMGHVMLEFIQDFYTAQKIFRILKPNNSLTEFAINKRLYDDAGQFTGTIENNVAIGQYDVYVEGGSMLPSNKYAQLSFYMEAYEKQIIDRVEVLKKTEIFDMEGVLKRIDEIEQLKAQLQQMQDYIKKLEGDLQTRERELFHSKMDNAVQKEANKAKDIKRDIETSKILAEGEISQKIKAASEAAQLEKDRIVMEEKNKTKKE